MSRRKLVKNITKKELIDDMKKIAEIIGRTPSKKDLRDYSKFSYHFYRSIFGSINDAQLKAGLKPTAGGKNLKYRKDDLINNFHKLKERLGKVPTQRDINNSKIPSGAYKRHFGSYNKFLDYLGESKNVDFNINPENIEKEVKRVYNKIGRTPTYDEFVNDPDVNFNVNFLAFSKLTGECSWNSVLKYCRIPVINRRNISEKELIEEIVRLKNKLGYVPGYADMAVTGKYSPETYALRYGTYIKALEHLGFSYIPINHWYNQVYTRGKDGKMYKSKIEAYAANALLKMLNNKKIISYEYEKIVCSEKTWTCDFYITTDQRNLWLEIDGMGKNRKVPYDSGNKKIEYYIVKNFDYAIFEYKSGNIYEEIERIVFDEM